MIFFKVLRIDQWTKNLFLFVPLFFAGGAFDFPRYQDLTLGFLAFCFIASAVYIVNDLCDYGTDRIHPQKRNRPIASGLVGLRQSLAVIVTLLVVGLSVSWWLNTYFFGLVAAYLIINVSYSFGIKNISIVDIFFVASGFLIRIYSGGILADVEVSHWLAIMVLLLSLFIALAKRRDDLVLSSDGRAIRRSSKYYNLEFINSCLSIFAGILIVAYILYTVSPEVLHRFNSRWLFFTSVFVIAGIMRYLQITFVDQKSGSPTQILYKDTFILVTICCWVISFCIIIYSD